MAVGKISSREELLKCIYIYIYMKRYIPTQLSAQPYPAPAAVCCGGCREAAAAMYVRRAANFNCVVLNVWPSRQAYNSNMMARGWQVRHKLCSIHPNLPGRLRRHYPKTHLCKKTNSPNATSRHHWSSNFIIPPNKKRRRTRQHNNIKTLRGYKDSTRDCPTMWNISIENLCL